MPSMSPDRPEEVTYDQYELLRDSGLPPVSLQEHERYTVRLRTKQPSAELFAFDCASRIQALKHMSRFSIVTFAAKFETVRLLAEVGINRDGILYNCSTYHEDPDEIPYKYELGYFVGQRGDIGARGAVPKYQREDTAIHVFEEDRELVLTH